MTHRKSFSFIIVLSLILVSILGTQKLFAATFVGPSTTFPGNNAAAPLGLVNNILQLPGTRPLTYNTGSGAMYVKGDAGGWAYGLFGIGSAGTTYGGFGFLGSADTLSYYYIGNFTSPIMALLPNGNVGIGQVSPAARLYVQGGAYGSTGNSNNAAYALGASNIGVDGSIYSYGPICSRTNAGNCTGANGTILDQNGINIQQSGGGIKFPDGSTQTTAATSGGGGTIGGTISAAKIPRTVNGTTLADSSISDNGTGSATENGNFNVTGALTLTGTGLLHVSGNTSPTLGSQGSYLGWNALTSGTGETDFINQEGSGSGGFAFYNSGDNTKGSLLAFLSGSGNLGIGTGASIPAHKLTVNGSIHTTAADTYSNINLGSDGYDLAGNQVGGADIYAYDAICVRNSMGNCTGTGGIVINGSNIKFPDGTTQTTAASITGSGTSGHLALFTPTGTNLGTSVISDNGTNVGIGKLPAPNAALDVNGTVKATAFVGDGSGLTGISSGAWLTNGNNVTLSNGANNVGIGAPAGTKLDVGNTISDTIRSYGGFVGNAAANIGGTGAAAYFPQGLWSAGSDAWIYGAIHTHGSITDTNTTNGISNMVLNPVGNSYFNGGSLGVGTTNPQAKLDVAGSGAFAGPVTSTNLFSTTDTGGNTAILSPTGLLINNTNGINLSFTTVTSNTGGLKVGVNSPGQVAVDGAAGSQAESGVRGLGNSDDYPGVGGSNNADGPGVRGIANGNGNGVEGIGAVGVYGKANTFNGYGVEGVAQNASQYGVYCTGGKCGSNGISWTTTSDGRLKENVKTIDNALTKVLDLRGVYYTWIDHRIPGNQIGFIAQEVLPIVPEAVSKDADGYYSMSYERIVPVLVEAMKDLNTNNTNLKAQNDALQTKYDSLEKRVEALEAKSK